MELTCYKAFGLIIFVIFLSDTFYTFVRGSIYVHGSLLLFFHCLLGVDECFRTQGYEIVPLEAV